MAETPSTTTPSGAAEPRALSAALSGPAFQTKNSGSAMHAATRHVERWAPEAGANRVRSLRNLGFVDRLVAPWLEVAQKSASHRLYQQYRSDGTAERELVALPGALYEHVAPSLSITPPARNDFAMPAALAAPAQPRIHDAYSPLVPFAAVNAAQVMQRAVAPLIGTADRGGGAAAMSPGLRSVLATMFQRSVTASQREPTRAAMQAPELVTPPATRPELAGDVAAQGPRAASEIASQTRTPSATRTPRVADAVSAQRAQIAELQRAARAVAERQLAERTQQQTGQQAQRAREDAAAQALLATTLLGLLCE